MQASLDPEGVWQARGRGFSMARLSDNGVLMHFTGQVAWDEDEQIVGKGDVAAQARQCFRNIGIVLAAAGGGLEHLVSITTYYTHPDQLPHIQAVRSEFLDNDRLPVSTSVMVAGLGHPDFLVELQPVAVIPADLIVRPDGG